MTEPLEHSTGPGDQLIVAIDQGTSATKAIVVDRTGRIRSKATAALTQSFPRPGWAEQDALEIWDSVQQAVTDSLAGLDPAAVVAIGLSTQRESTLLWDRASGAPLGPVLGWQDTRGAALCARLREAGQAERVRAITGLPLDAMFSASKAAALLDEHDPDRVRSRAGELCLGTVDSWMIWQLGGGRHLIEAGNASRTMLLDIDAGQWDPWLLELFDIPAAVLPAVVASTGPFVTATALDALPSPVPVTGVLGDSHAALIAHAGWQPGRVKVTYGTGSSVMGVTTGQHTPTGVARTIAWDLGTPTYALEGNIRSSGATLVWLARLFNTTPAEIAASAADSSNGVTIVPAFTGLGAPWWDDQAQALISGLSEVTTRHHLARAGLESIAFQVEDVIAAIATGEDPIEVILADGGPSTNPVLMQVQADLSDRRVKTTSVSELSALGAAHIAGLGIGLWSIADLEDLPRNGVTYTSALSQHQRRDKQSTWHAAINAAISLPRTSGAV
jgi:glycerol kinase